MNKVKHLFLVLLLVMAHLQLSATNIELSWSFNQGDAKALQGTVSEEGLFLCHIIIGQRSGILRNQ